jgi:hypothetical protein
MILAYGAFLGVCLAIQGIYILRRGFASPFFLTPTAQSQPLVGFRRYVNGVIYLMIATTVIALVARLILSRPGGIDTSALGPAVFLGVTGIFFLVRPDIAIQWAKRSNPNIAQSAFALAIARIVAGLLLFGGLIFITSP